MNWYAFTDCVWPLLQPEEGDHELRQHLQKPSGTWTTQSKEAHQAVMALIVAEDDRLRSVDTKLQGLLTMAPITATLIVALVTFVTKEPQAYTVSSVTFIVAGGAYVILQFIRTVWAAIAGLSVQEFQRVRLQELAPQPCESDVAYSTRIVESQIKCFLHNSDVTDRKVSQLKVAHRAIKNALVVLLLVVIALGIIAITNLVQRSG